MNKRGFIRTLEAVIAIVVVFLFIFYASRSGTGKDARFVEGIRSLQESILDDISKDDEFRKCIVEYEPLDMNDNGRDDISEGSAYVESESVCFGMQKLGEFIDESLPARFRGQGENFEFVVCEIGSCTLPDIKGNEVYTSAVIVTSSLEGEKYKPRILRLWLY